MYISNKMNGLKKFYPLFVAVFSSAPLFFAMAAGEPDPGPLRKLIDTAKDTLVKNVIPLLLVIATVIFIVALIRYIFSIDANKAKMRETMLWTVISLAVILSLWALVTILSAFFGTVQSIPQPTLPATTPI